jgi:L-fuconolactonase
MRIDSHQHYWRLARGDYGWLTPALSPIYRDFAPADLAPALKRHAIGRTIAVQAAPSVAETQFLLDIAATEMSVAGVVGWADLTHDRDVDDLARNRLLVGLRPMLHDLPDPAWMLRPDLQPALRAMAAAGLVFDALVRSVHLPYLCRFAAAYPDLSIVIDHGGKPEIAAKRLDPWRADMAALAAFPNVVCKLSGLATEAAKDWTPADLAPYISHLLATFGPQRLMWGSDWPVLDLAGGYDPWFAAALESTQSAGIDGQAAIFGANAHRIYLTRRGRI